LNILPSDATGDARVPHAILIGLPGVGKSTVGRRVSRMIGREFIDFDEEIARREGISIKEIFRTAGESHFRKLELGLTRELASRRALILAPGGGWICQREAAELLRGAGRTIYLRVTPESVFRRSRRISERPLLAGPDPLGKLKELHEARRHLYEKSDYVVDAETLTKEQLVSEVARIVAALEEE
jgi:shikimate kinase